MSHTPGPWRIGYRSKYYQQQYTPVEAPILGSVHSAVAWLVMEEESGDDGNARLIAAAPALLHALEEIRDLLQAHIRPDYAVRCKALGFAEAACALMEDPDAQP